MQEVLSKFPLPWLSCVGLLIFLAVFVGVVIWVFRKGSTELYAKLESAPLEES